MRKRETQRMALPERGRKTMGTWKPGSVRWLALALATALATTLAPLSAPAGPAVGGATEWTQLFNNAELGVIAGLESRILSTETQSLLKQTRQLATQIRAYEIMQRNIKGLPEQHKRAALGSVLRLRGIASEAGAIAHSGQSLDRFLRSGLITDPLYERDGLDRARISERYDDWQSQWQASLGTGLGVAGATMADAESEARLLDLVSRRFGTETGQMQVLQGANQLAASMARQLTGLRAITATQVEQNGIAWSRVLADMDRKEAAKRRHEREAHETLEALEAAPPGRTLEEIFLD